MRFAAEKRRLLGWLALLAPLPLPLNEPRPIGVVSWPVVLLWVLLMVGFLRRARSTEARWLGHRSLNLLGLAYLPLLAVDLASAGTGFLVRPMMHLALFALGAKLFSMERERDKWHAVLGIFFIFVTATATSTSLGIVLYLLAFIAVAVVVLGRFASLHMESFEEDSVEDPPPVSRRGRWLLPVTFALMIPIFWLLPRFSNPFIFGSGGGSLRVGTGFSDEVRLDGIGRIRTSSEVALRLEPGVGGEPSDYAGVRLRGATYDAYLGDRWEQTEAGGRVRVDPEGILALGDGPTEASVTLWLEPLDARAVIVPERTQRLISDFRGAVQVNRAGALSFLIPPNGTVTYRAELGREPPPWGPAPGADESTEPTLDQAGVTPGIRALAAEVAGTGPSPERILRIESHLQTAYDYELELLGADGPGAIERFLFERRSGHCEYFASAMVLMLRSQGIPARFVTGFLGSEPSPLGYAIVRQSNAHAWVEAWVEGEGWRVFDPTPPAGRPTGRRGSVLELARQAYDWMVFSWDRYVVGFGTGEQRRVWGVVTAWFRSLFQSDEEPAGERVAEDTATLAVEGAAPTGVGPRRGWWLLWPGLLAVAVGAVWWWRYRGSDARHAYLSVRRVARRGGLRPASGPLRFAEQCSRRFPSAADPVRAVVQRYVEVSFGGRASEDAPRLRRDAAEARRRIRGEARRRRRELRRAS